MFWTRRADWLPSLSTSLRTTSWRKPLLTGQYVSISIRSHNCWYCSITNNVISCMTQRVEILHGNTGCAAELRVLLHRSVPVSHDQVTQCCRSDGLNVHVSQAQVFNSSPKSDFGSGP